MEEKDLRGLDLRADNFKTQLNLLINESNLVPSMVLYILKDCVREIELLYNQAVSYQYEEFCKIVNKEEEENKQKENKE